MSRTEHELKAHRLRIEAQAVERVRDTGTATDLAGHLSSAAESLRALARRQEAVAHRSGGVASIPVNASDAELRSARVRHAVRRGDDVYLPIVGERAVALPNALLRSSLFGATDSSLIAVKEHEIAAQGSVSITLTGFRLSGYDKHVFAVCLMLYQGEAPLSPCAHELPQWMTTSFYFLASAMGVPYGSQVKKAIRDSLVRLNAAHLRLRCKGRDIPLPRLLDVEFHDGSRVKGGGGIVKLRVDEMMAGLFGPHDWTAVHEDVLKVETATANWLSTFLATHAGPWPLKISDLWRWSGAACDLREFRRRLKKAADCLLEKVNVQQVHLKSYEIDGDSITFHLYRWEHAAQCRL